MVSSAAQLASKTLGKGNFPNHGKQSQPMTAKWRNIWPRWRKVVVNEGGTSWSRFQTCPSSFWIGCDVRGAKAEPTLTNALLWRAFLQGRWHDRTRSLMAWVFDEVKQFGKCVPECIFFFTISLVWLLLSAFVNVMLFTSIRHILQVLASFSCVVATKIGQCQCRRPARYC